MTGAFVGERVVVIGAETAGAAAALVLADEGADVSVSDARALSELARAAELTARGITVHGGGHDPSHLDGATLVVTSPGVAPEAPVLTWAAERGIPVWGELELGARLCRVPCLAVTGTNGKTTATGMLAAILRAGGLDAIACGNIGHPFPVAAREGHEALVVEASSFQLRLAETFHPEVSVLLNLAPDHLDHHGSMRAYAGAKRKVFANQIDGDTHVGNADDPASSAISREARCRVVWFRLDAPAAGEVGYRGTELVSRIDGDVGLAHVEDPRPGYRADAAAAAAAAIAFGVDPGAVRIGLATYEPARHRGEVVAEVRGVRFIDDSKATNVHAALAALDATRDAVLIAGGRAKGVDLSPLTSRADRLVGVVALGESAAEVAGAFEDLVPTRVAGSIEDAARLALDLAIPGGVVLLAPACASWDMFRDYAERGDRFAAAARALGAEVATRG
jgi:UDP-N-acetylmuramoylalanine--D-glutamate ligase